MEAHTDRDDAFRIDLVKREKLGKLHWVNASPLAGRELALACHSLGIPCIFFFSCCNWDRGIRTVYRRFAAT